VTLDDLVELLVGGATLTGATEVADGDMVDNVMARGAAPDARLIVFVGRLLVPPLPSVSVTRTVR